MDTHLDRDQWSIRALAAICAVLLFGKLVVLSTPAAFMDEAYYWIWGQHPALSYFDHPPLNAWLQSVSSTLFGWSVFSLRAMVAVLLVLDVAILWLFARRFAPPGKTAQRFLVSLALFLSTPIFVGVTSVALPDHVLLTGLLLATYGFSSFLTEWQVGRKTRWRDLFLGAVALGLAGLAKYNAALLGVGFALALALVPAYRPLLLRWQVYAAGLLAIGLQLPVLLWNLQNDFASFGFILGGRHYGLNVALGGVPPYLAGILVFLMPPVLLAVWRLYREAAQVTRLARVTAAFSTLLFLAVSLVTGVLYHWNLVAYAALLPFLAPYAGRWPLAAQAGIGAAFIGFLIVNFQVVPILRDDEATVWAYGWPELAVALDAERAKEPVGFLAGTDYPTSSLLAFAMRDPGVANLTPGTDAFDFWFDGEAHRGEDALIVTDRLRGRRELTLRQFDSMEQVATIPVERFGVPVNTFHIWRARRFDPDMR